MKRALIDFIFGPRRHVQFVTRLPVDTAVNHLADRVETSRWAQLFHQHVYGRVSANSVYLERVTPFFSNSWRPVFEGRFEDHPDGTLLVGSFGTATATRRIILFAIAFCMLWTVGAGWSVVSIPQPGLPFWFPIGGIGMAGIVVLMSRAAAASSSGDVEWLTDRVQEALGAHASHRRPF